MNCADEKLKMLFLFLFLLLSVLQVMITILEGRQREPRPQTAQIDRQDVNQSQIPNDNAERGVINTLKRQLLISQLSSKPPSQRNQKDCRSLGQLLKNEPYFISIAKNSRTLMDICSWIEYKKVKEGDYIYRINDSSECFYVIIKGEVHLTCPDKQDDQDDEDKQKQEAILQTNSKVLSQTSIYSTAVPKMAKSFSKPEGNPIKRLGRMNTIIQATKETIKKKIVFLQRIIRVVVSGESFGDLSNTNKRGTNAVAKQPTHLLVIRKQNYSVISHAQLISQNRRKYDFLSQLPFFLPLHRYTLQSILYFLEEMRVGYNSGIYHQEDNQSYVYIIYKGQFKLYKKVSCNKTLPSEAEYQLDIQQKRITQRKSAFKTIGQGQILGHTEAYNKVRTHQEACICKSQDGVVLKIDKKKFIKTILSVDNNVEQIIQNLAYKTEEKARQIQEFMNKQQSGSIYARYMHTPSAKSRRVATVSSSERERHHNKQTLKYLSDSNDNFFNRFNKTVKNQFRQTKISINRSLQSNDLKRQNIPSRIRDIVEMVGHQTNYHRIRKPKQKQEVRLFEFNITKVPLHVKKRFQALFKATKK